MNHTLKTLVSVFILCSSVVFNVFLINKYLVRQTLPQQLESRKLIDLSAIDLPAKSKILVMYLSTSCRYCNQSARFWARLTEIGKDRNVKFIAVFPADDGAQGELYLDKLGLSDIEVEPLALTNFQISGTPTLALFNDRGEFLSSWVGKLPPEKEKEVVEIILSEK